MKCKDCGDEMNPIQAMLSSTHGVCGSCTRKKQKLVFLRDENLDKINKLLGRCY